MSEKFEGTPSPKEYLMSSEQLLSPETGAVEIGALEAGQYHALHQKMMQEAREHGISNPLMVADLIFREGKRSELGSPGQPYPITKSEWEQFVKDVLEYCGDKVPKIYMVDGDRFTAPI